MKNLNLLSGVGMLILGLVSSASAQEARIEFGAPSLEPGQLLTDLRTEDGDLITLTPVYTRVAADGTVEVTPALDEKHTVLNIGAVAHLATSNLKSAALGVGVIVGRLSGGVMNQDSAIGGLLISAEAGILGGTAGIGYGSLVEDFQAQAGLQATVSRFYAGNNVGDNYAGIQANANVLILGASVGVMKKISANNPAASRWLFEVQARLSLGVIAK